MGSPYKAFQICVKRKDLILGEAFAIFIFRFISQILDFIVLTGLHFYFWWRDNENREYDTQQQFILVTYHF